MTELLPSSVINKFNFQASNYTVLIVEDSKYINRIVTKSFSGKGFNCFNVFTLEEARNILKTESIDYIILDIHLPDGNGFELISELEDSKEKIFVLTSSADKEFQNITYKKGIMDFIIKDEDFLYKINQIQVSIEKLEKNHLKTILIIDDSLLIQKQLKNILGNQNYKTEVADEPISAMQIINEKQIDLILLDVELKNANGIEFLKKNKNYLTLKRNIPVMIISGNVDVSIIRDGLKAGAVDVIKKPYIFEEIILKVGLWIDYKRQEEEIKSSATILEEYKHTVDISSIVSKTDANGFITYVNDKFCEISGYKKDELIGKAHSLLRHPDMESSVFENMWKTIKVDKKPWFGTIKNKAKNGTAYYVDSVINPIFDNKGKLIEYIGIRHDITEIEESKISLQKQYAITSNKYEDILYLSKSYENAIEESNVILRVGLDKSITYANDMFCKISGYSLEELIGKPYSIIKHPEVSDEDVDNLWAILESGNIWKGNLKNLSKNGDTYYSLATIVPIKSKNGNIIEYIGIRKDITELVTLHNEIEETQRELIYKLGEIGETRSKETGNHVKRVAEYSKLLALLSGLSKEEAELLKYASPMHDIGKIGIPDSILNKPAKLTADEFEIMKTHSSIGYEMLKGSNRPILQTSAIVSNEHHEKWDGSGYPSGLKGNNIHIYGRITAIADVFDALASDRPYKKAWDNEKIFALFTEQKGIHFDPNLVDLFFNNLEAFLVIKEKFS